MALHLEDQQSQLWMNEQPPSKYNFFCSLPMRTEITKNYSLVKASPTSLRISQKCSSPLMIRECQHSFSPPLSNITNALRTSVRGGDAGCTPCHQKARPHYFATFMKASTLKVKMKQTQECVLTATTPHKHTPKHEWEQCKSEATLIPRP